MNLLGKPINGHRLFVPYFTDNILDFYQEPLKIIV